MDGFGTGNAALRASFLGYDPNSVFTRTVGQSNYNALQLGVNKRFSHGLQITYDVWAFNIFNHPSFDIPSNDVSFDPLFANPPFNPITGGVARPFAQRRAG